MHPAYLIVIFCVLFALVLLVVTTGVRHLESGRKKKVAGMLETVDGTPSLPESALLMSDTPNRFPGFFERLTRLPLLRQMQVTIWQAGLAWPVTRLLVFMAIGAAAGMLLGAFVPNLGLREFAILGLGGLLGWLPYFYVRHRRTKRLWAFEEQFPEALDFMARSLRGGHAFSVSLEMIAAESPDPLGIEFRQLFNAQNLGSPLDVAMRNLAERVPLLDVKFFVSAVLLQRETGGNLSEILTRLAYVIRERFRLKGQVRAASAHGRLTAGVLTIMPIVTALGFLVIWPGYLEGMARDRTGRYLIVGAVILFVIGRFLMKRVVNIKV